MKTDILTRTRGPPFSVRELHFLPHSQAQPARKPFPNVCYFRSEYYTIPPLAELNQKIDSNGDVFVDDFVVGRQGYGQVKFYGRTNVAGLNLDEIGK